MPCMQAELALGRALLGAAQQLGRRHPRPSAPGAAACTCLQGTRAWARAIEYYVAHPITAGGGQNVVYETHPCEWAPLHAWSCRVLQRGTLNVKGAACTAVP